MKMTLGKVITFVILDFILIFGYIFLFLGEKIHSKRIENFEKKLSNEDNFNHKKKILINSTIANLIILVISQLFVIITFGILLHILIDHYDEWLVEYLCLILISTAGVIRFIAWIFSLVIITKTTVMNDHY